MTSETYVQPQCDSCGAEVSPAAESCSRGLEHVSAATAAVLEVTYGVTVRDLHLCAECLIAGYALLVPRHD